ncbi:MAG: hypothetical protein EBZ77_02805 [Chitinophagia bacterium]|nr:hypothetical protein [Chitinophagia bacterium]
MKKCLSSILLLLLPAVVSAQSKPALNTLKVDSVAVYKLIRNLTKSGNVDLFWSKRDSTLVFMQNIQPKYLDSLFKLVNVRKYYNPAIEWTPFYNVALVFFYKGVKTGYMSFNIKDWDGGSVIYSHYVPAFEYGKVDMTNRGGAVYYTAFNEKGKERIRNFCIFAGFSDSLIKDLRGHIPVSSKKK